MSWSSYTPSIYQDRELSGGPHKLWQMGSLHQAIEDVSGLSPAEAESKLDPVMFDFARASLEWGINYNYVKMHALYKVADEEFLVPQHLTGTVDVICVAGELQVATEGRQTYARTIVCKAQLLFVATKCLRLPTRTLISAKSDSALLYIIGSDRTGFLDF